jgi:hypothetical protein
VVVVLVGRGAAGVVVAVVVVFVGLVVCWRRGCLVVQNGGGGRCGLPVGCCLVSEVKWWNVDVLLHRLRLLVVELRGLGKEVRVDQPWVVL